MKSNSSGLKFMHADSSPPIFLGGAYRSGLTLLRAILDSHPEIACPPDLAIVPTIAVQWEQANRVLGENLAHNYATDRNALRAAFAGPVLEILQRAARTAGKRLIADKTPVNALAFPLLRRLFPESPLVHVLRDGRDVTASLLAQGWRDPRTGNLLPMCASVSGAGRHWKSSIMQAGAAGRLGGGFFIVRFEDLVTDPETALTPLLEALGLGFEEPMLRFYEHERAYIELEECSLPQLLGPLDRSRVGRWRQDFDDVQRLEFEQEFAPVLVECGYSRN